jgi:hypothetical protein
MAWAARRGRCRYVLLLVLLLIATMLTDLTTSTTVLTSLVIMLTSSLGECGIEALVEGIVRVLVGRGLRDGIEEESVLLLVLELLPLRWQGRVLCITSTASDADERA